MRMCMVIEWWLNYDNMEGCNGVSVHANYIQRWVEVDVWWVEIDREVDVEEVCILYIHTPQEGEGEVK